MAQSAGKRRPLEGVRVIDLTKIVAGPNATRMLATMGAEVIRVEWHDQRALDLLRGVRPAVPGGDPESLNRSGLFNNINPGKRGITLNMSLPQGRDLFKRLIAKAQVVCENYSPGQMDRWELGYNVLREINPGLIYMQITGMGKSGTYKDYVSVGPTAQALSGLTHMSGLPDHNHRRVGAIPTSIIRPATTARCWYWRRCSAVNAPARAATSMCPKRRPE